MIFKHCATNLLMRKYTVFKSNDMLELEDAANSFHQVKECIAKDKLNAFVLMRPFSEHDDHRSVRVSGIYPHASFFKHDWLPNACIFDHVNPAHHTEASPNNTFIWMFKDLIYTFDSPILWRLWQKIRVETKIVTRVILEEPSNLMQSGQTMDYATMKHYTNNHDFRIQTLTKCSWLDKIVLPLKFSVQN